MKGTEEAATKRHQLQQHQHKKTCHHPQDHKILPAAMGKCLPYLAAPREDKEKPSTRHENEDIVEWLRDKPAIYNHDSSNWKGWEVKEDLITEQVKMNCTFSLLDR